MKLVATILDELFWHLWFGPKESYSRYIGLRRQHVPSAANNIVQTFYNVCPVTSTKLKKHVNLYVMLITIESIEYNKNLNSLS